jgi:hypothetical protein
VLHELGDEALDNRRSGGSSLAGFARSRVKPSSESNTFQPCPLGANAFCANDAAELRYGLLATEPTPSVEATATVETADSTAVSGASAVDPTSAVAVNAPAPIAIDTAAAITVDGPASITIVAGPAVVPAVDIRPTASIRTAVKAGPATTSGLSSADADVDPALIEHTHSENGRERSRNEYYQSRSFHLQSSQERRVPAQRPTCRHLLSSVCQLVPRRGTDEQETQTLVP